MTTKSFCSRPGCGLSRALHGVSSIACGNYIDPTSRAGVALRKLAEALIKSRRLAIVETPPPSVDVPPYVELEFDDVTVVERPKTIAQIAAEWTDQQGAR